MTRRDRFRELLRTYGNRVSPDPVLSPQDNDADWFDVDEADDGWEDETVDRPPVRLFGPGARPLTWKEHLGALRYTMEAMPGERVPDWPDRREIVYVVDGPGTLAQ